MNVGELIASFRFDTDDVVRSVNGSRKDLLFQDADIVRLLNEAEEEACIRKRLIYEADNLDITELDVSAGTNVYALDPRMFEVVRASLYRFGQREPMPLTITDRDERDRCCPGWRFDRSEPQRFIQEDTRLVIPNQILRDYTIRLEGYRLPLEPMTETNLKGCPEISPVHHRFLVFWAEHRAYEKPDSEVFNPKKSATALAKFEEYFGYRLQANAGGRNQASRPHHTQAYW